jgi:hypothetical protein
LESVQNPRTEVTPFIAVETKPAVESSLMVASGPKSASKSIVTQSTKPVQDLKPVQIQKPVVKTIPGTAFPRIPTYKAPIVRLTSGGFVPGVPFVGVPGFSVKPSTPAFGGGFRVFVRRGGEFKPTGPVLSKAEALEFGAFKVDSTPAASFKIKPVSGSPTGSFAGKGFFSFFKPSKRESGVFVEPASRRIRTPGEKRGITLKGIQSQRLTARKVFK